MARKYTLLSPRISKWTVVSALLLPLCLQYLLFSSVLAGSIKRVNFQPTFMTPDEVISYFRSFLTKSSTQDRTNEAHYYPTDYAEDLHHKIDNLMPSPLYFRWLMKTKSITDNSQLSNYVNSINAQCAKTSVFNQTVATILNTWDGDKTIAANEIEQWHQDNERTPPFEICNRFRGLTCQFRRAIQPELDAGEAFIQTTDSTCQCGGDSKNVGFFKSPPLDTTDTKRAAEMNSQRYTDGCYVRPWRSCKHLSDVDATFKDSYHDYHKSLENERRVLASMVFPVARTHRCKQGTYCLDLIPGFKKPICWCTANNYLDKACNDTREMANETKAVSTTPSPTNHTLIKHNVPLLGSNELMILRRNFMKVVLPASDTRSLCSPDFNEDIIKLIKGAGTDPTKSGSVTIMRKILQAKKKKSAKICDFREALLCDVKTRTCVGNLNCGVGKVHLGQGVCANNNGFPCQSNEDCVVNARCKYFKTLQASSCVCESGYGDRCQLNNKPFFSSRFLPGISGFEGQEYIKIQTEMGKILETWEDSQTLKLGDRCDATLDAEAMEVVKYFGDLEKYEKSEGATMLQKAKHLIRDGNAKMCMYKRFQRCDSLRRKCMPIVGNHLVSYTSVMEDDGLTLAVELNENEDCEPQVIQIFLDPTVTFTCIKGFSCQMKGTGKFCLPDCSSSFAPPSCQSKPKLKGKGSLVSAEWDALKGRAVPLLSQELDDDQFNEPKLSGRAVNANKPEAFCDDSNGGNSSDPLCKDVNCPNPDDPRCSPSCENDNTQDFCADCSGATQPLPPACKVDCELNPDDDRCTNSTGKCTKPFTAGCPCYTDPADENCPKCSTNPNEEGCPDCSLSTADARCCGYNPNHISCGGNGNATGPDCLHNPNHPSCAKHNMTGCTAPNCPSPEKCSSEPFAIGCPCHTTPTNDSCPKCSVNPIEVGCPDCSSSNADVNCCKLFNPNHPNCPNHNMTGCNGADCPATEKCSSEPFDMGCPCHTTPTDDKCPKCSVDPNLDGCPDCSTFSAYARCCELFNPKHSSCKDGGENPENSTSVLTLKLGEMCSRDRDLCDKSAFQECALNMDQSQAVCSCLTELWPRKSDKTCAIPYDGECGKDRIFALEADHGIGRFSEVPPPCFDGECVLVNDNPFCRPSETLDFPLFVSSKRASELRRMMSRSSRDVGGTVTRLITVCTGMVTGLFWMPFFHLMSR